MCELGLQCGVVGAFLIGVRTLLRGRRSSVSDAASQRFRAASYARIISAQSASEIVSTSRPSASSAQRYESVRVAKSATLGNFGVGSATLEP